MKVKREKSIEFTSISVPTKLFEKAKKHIDGTGFPSVSSYVAFLLRMILSDRRTSGKADYETDMLKKRLRELGYL